MGYLVPQHIRVVFALPVLRLASNRGLTELVPVLFPPALGGVAVVADLELLLWGEVGGWVVE